MTNTIADIESADVILITGSNTTENHPVLSSVVKRAARFRGHSVFVQIERTEADAARRMARRVESTLHLETRSSQPRKVTRGRPDFAARCSANRTETESTRL